MAAAHARAARPAADRALKRLRLDREAPLVGRADGAGALGATVGGARAAARVLLLGGPSGVGQVAPPLRLPRAASRRPTGPPSPRAAGVGAGGRSYQPFVEALLDLLVPRGRPGGATRGALEARLAPLLADTPGVVPPFVDFLSAGSSPASRARFSKDALLAAAARDRAARSRRSGRSSSSSRTSSSRAPRRSSSSATSRAASPGHPLLLLGVYADDEVEEGSPLHALPSRRAAPDRDRAPRARPARRRGDRGARAGGRAHRDARCARSRRPLYERERRQPAPRPRDARPPAGRRAPRAESEGLELTRPARRGAPSRDGRATSSGLKLAPARRRAARDARGGGRPRLRVRRGAPRGGARAEPASSS